MTSVDRLQAPDRTSADPPLRIAGLGGRAYAFVVDWHIRTMAGLGWYAASMWILYQDFTVTRTDSTFWLVVFAPSAGIYLLYHPVLEVVTGGTPGKRIAGVRIVARDGRPAGIAALAIRNLLRPIDSLLLYAVGLASVLVTAQAVRLGDIVAGTLLAYVDEDGQTDTR